MNPKSTKKIIKALRRAYNIDPPKLKPEELLQKLVDLDVLKPNLQIRDSQAFIRILRIACAGMVQRGYIDKLQHLEVLVEISAHLNHPEYYKI